MGCSIEVIIPKSYTDLEWCNRVALILAGKPNAYLIDGLREEYSLAGNNFWYSPDLQQLRARYWTHEQMDALKIVLRTLFLIK